MIRVAVVEDDAAEAARISGYLERYSKKSGEPVRVSVFGDGLDFLEKYKGDTDVIFMDIEMPHMNGMEAAERLRTFDAEVPLVFITNLKQFALKGYKVFALDFLVKPVSYAAFSTMMDRVRTRITLRGGGDLYIRNAEGGYHVRIADIRYVEIVRHYLVYHTVNGDIRVWGSLTDAEKLLPAASFARCNSCFLVNLAYVDKVEGSDLYIGKDVLAVSRGKRNEFMKRMLAYMEG